MGKLTIWMLWIGLLVILLSCQTGPDETAAVLEAPVEMTPLVTPSASTPLPATSVATPPPPLAPLSMVLSAEQLPTTIQLSMQVNEACTLQSPPQFEWSGSVVTLIIDTECAEPLSMTTRPQSLTTTLTASGQQPGFYVLEWEALRQPIVIAQTVERDLSTPLPAGATVEAGAGQLSGRVWHDACHNRAEGEEPPSGCIRRGSEAGWVANGRHDPAEEGIPQTVVTLRIDSCDGRLVAQTTTDIAGFFLFDRLPLGQYCVEIPPDEPLNRLVLLPGRWSAPPAVAQSRLAQVQVELTAGRPAQELLFGWDYDLLPRESIATACQNKGWIQADGALPEGSTVARGATVQKSWQVQNIGTCTWIEGYQIAPLTASGVVDLDQAQPLAIELPPGETIELQITVVAPETAGRWRQRWILLDDKNTPFGVGLTEPRPLWLDLQVE